MAYLVSGQWPVHAEVVMYGDGGTQCQDRLGLGIPGACQCPLCPVSMHSCG
jgi:hypothetical protein